MREDLTGDRLATLIREHPHQLSADVAAVSSGTFTNSTPVSCSVYYWMFMQLINIVHFL